MFVHININYFVVDITLLFLAYNILSIHTSKFELAMDYTNYMKL